MNGKTGISLLNLSWRPLHIQFDRSHGYLNGIYCSGQFILRSNVPEGSKKIKTKMLQNVRCIFRIGRNI